MAKKIIPYIDLSSYKLVEAEMDAIYFNRKEILAFYKLDLPNDSKLEIVQDEFILGCLTGFRFSDYSTIQPDETGMECISSVYLKPLTEWWCHSGQRQKQY